MTENAHPHNPSVRESSTLKRRCINTQTVRITPTFSFVNSSLAHVVIGMLAATKIQYYFIFLVFIFSSFTSFLSMSTAESRKNRSNADILCNPSITKLYCSQAQGMRLDKMVSVLILPNQVIEIKN